MSELAKKRAGYTPIRLSKKDREEYRKLTNNAKAKIRRQNKNYGVDISNLVDLPKLEEIKTRKQFNKFKEQVQWFTNRANTQTQFKKNKYGVVASVSEINEVKKATKQAQKVAKKIEKDNEKLPFISGDKQYGTVKDRRQLMGNPNTGGIQIPVDFNFEAMQTRKRFDLRKANMEERSDPLFLDKRSARMQENFASLMETNFNSHADELVKEIRKLPPKDFFEIYLMFDDVDFDLYDSDGMSVNDEEAIGKVERMRGYIERYKNKQLNFDLQGF